MPEFSKRILGKRMTGYRMTDPFGQVRSRSRQLAVMVAAAVKPVLAGWMAVYLTGNKDINTDRSTHSILQLQFKRD
jgi:hypothetical protein